MKPFFARRSALCSAVFTASLAAASAAGAASYTFTDLGGLSGGNDHGEGFAINNSGQVAGYSDGRAFLWDKDLGMIDLGDLSGGALSGAGLALNDSGVVAGIAFEGDGDRAAVWKMGVGIGKNYFEDDRPQLIMR